MVELVDDAFERVVVGDHAVLQVARGRGYFNLVAMAMRPFARRFVRNIERVGCVEMARE
jgi:hypothetical protein